MNTTYAPQQSNGFDPQPHHSYPSLSDGRGGYRPTATPAYSPTTPAYSPTTPAYSPTTPAYGSAIPAAPAPFNQAWSQPQEPVFAATSGTWAEPETGLPARTPRRRQVDQGRFWVGAVLSAVVAAMAGVIGMVIAQGLLKVPVALGSIGLNGAHIATFGLLAALITLGAALVYDGMVAFAPHPTLYYGWVLGLLTALAVLLPFTSSVAISSQVALAAINLVVGVTIMILVPMAASSARARI